jgi:hypothetical protein
MNVRAQIYDINNRTTHRSGGIRRTETGIVIMQLPTGDIYAIKIHF